MGVLVVLAFSGCFRLLFETFWFLLGFLLIASSFFFFFSEISHFTPLLAAYSKGSNVNFNSNAGTGLEDTMSLTVGGGGGGGENKTMLT